MPMLFLWAGFAAKWDNCLMDSHGYGYLHGGSFVKSLARDFGRDLVDVINYDANPFIFAENLACILPEYGINESEALKLIKLDKLNVTSTKSVPSAAWAEILLSRRECSREINKLMHEFSFI